MEGGKGSRVVVWCGVVCKIEMSCIKRFFFSTRELVGWWVRALQRRRYTYLFQNLCNNDEPARLQKTFAFISVRGPSGECYETTTSVLLQRCSGSVANMKSVRVGTTFPFTIVLAILPNVPAQNQSQLATAVQRTYHCRYFVNKSPYKR